MNARLRKKPERIGESFVLRRRSARDRRCDDCGSLIRKGAEYARHTLPPDSDLGNSRWRSISTCGVTTVDCRWSDGGAR